jgi:phosphate transport system permease protein
VTVDQAATPFRAGPREQRALSVQRLAAVFTMLATVVLVLPALVILAMLLVKGAPALSLDFLFDMPRDNNRGGGIWSALVGTLWLTAGAVFLAMPLGVAAAIYLNEFAGNNRLTRLIQIAIVNLAGVPSIVHALFGVGAFVHFLKFGLSILAASCTLAVMTLPVVIVATRESLQSVPMAFREACWSMGATRWQTIWRVVLPNSGSGILTGMILAVSRTVGETAPIMFTGVVFSLGFLPASVFDQGMALSLHLYNISTQVSRVPEAVPFAVALVLIGVVLLLNAGSIALRLYLRRRKRW